MSEKSKTKEDKNENQEKDGRVSDNVLQQVLQDAGVEVMDLDNPRNSIKPSTWHY